jgi:hypothetical protein
MKESKENRAAQVLGMAIAAALCALVLSLLLVTVAGLWISLLRFAEVGP